MGDYNKRLQEQNHRYDYACVFIFHKYQELVCAIKRDERLNERFKFWNLKGDLQEAYRAVLDALFGDSAKFDKDIAKLKADDTIIKSCQIFNWSASSVLEGYRQQTDYAIKHKLMPKKTAERMYENFKKKFEEEELPDKLAHSFELALIRIGESELRHIYDVLGEDYEAAHKNYERYLEKKRSSKETSAA